MTTTFIDITRKYFNGQRLIRSRAVLVSIAICITITIAQDYMRSMLNRSAFYFSESLLYTSFWWCFFPVLFFAQGLFRKWKNGWNGLRTSGLVVLSVFFHLLLTPLFIWGISALLLDHTYAFRDVLAYTIAEQFYILLVLYALAILGLRALFRQEKANAPVQPASSGTLQQLLVSNGKTSVVVDIASILYISAATPYLHIHLPNNKLLYTGTLKSIAEKLDSSQFIRIHKSTIVNGSKVVSFTSRMNGDYDLLLQNGAIIRLSRNYWPAFRSRFGNAPQVK